MPSAGVRVTEVELGVVERLVALRAFPGAHALGSPALVALASIAEPIEVKQGTTFVRPRERVGALYVVVEGAVRAVARGRAGPQRIEAQGVVGLAHALARDASGLECVAEVDTIMLQIDVEDLEDVFEDHPGALVLAARELSRRAMTEGHDMLGVAQAPRRGGPGPFAPVLDRALDLVERLLFLRSHPVIGAASLDGAAVLASAAVEVRHRRGDVLWSAGAPSSSALYLLSGAVRVPAGKDARRVGPREARAGEALGELECIADLPRRASVTAIHDVHALVIERDAMLDAWEDHVGLGMEVLRALGASLVEDRAGARTETEPAASPPEGEP